MNNLFMANSSMSANTAVKPRIVLVEDDHKDLDKMIVELAKNNFDKPDTATRYGELSELLGKAEYDVASIDWELHGVEKGGDILQLLVRSYPEVARVVFTQHTKRGEEAMR